MKQAIAIRHVAFEGLGLLEPLLAEAGIAITYVEATQADFTVLDGTYADLLVILGGPIGANDEADYPFLKAECELIKARLAADKPTLGICLGAQLMARALGANVYAAEEKEIGWAPVHLTGEGQASPLHVIGEKPVLHWHGDTFDLPDGATLLASTDVCPNQAFSAGQALGLQFHIETTAKDLQDWFVGHAAEIKAVPGVSVSGLRKDTETFAPELEKTGARVLSAWLDEVGLIGEIA